MREEAPVVIGHEISLRKNVTCKSDMKMASFRCQCPSRETAILDLEGKGKGDAKVPSINIWVICLL